MAVYLANRAPSTPLGGKTPFSMWHGGHLRDFSNFELLVPEFSCMKSDTSS